MMVRSKDNPVPRYLQVTGSSKERPDVWITDPRKSVVLQVPPLLKPMEAFRFRLRAPRLFPSLCP